MQRISHLGKQLKQARAQVWQALAVDTSCLQSCTRSYSKLPAEYEKYYDSIKQPVRRVLPQAAKPVAPAEVEAFPSEAAAAEAPQTSTSEAGSTAISIEQQRQSAAAVSRWMFPWEKRQMDSKPGPLKTWERFYWGLFVGGLALLLFNRLPGNKSAEAEDPKVAEEKEANKLRAARLLAAGQSLIGDDDEDVFEGLSPKDIQAYVEKALGQGASLDPFEGMSPEEINEMLSSNKQIAAR